VERIEADSDAGGPRHAVCWREHARGVENQQRVREITGAKMPTAISSRRNGGGRAFSPIRKERGGFGPVGRSRTRSQKHATAVMPGKRVQRKTLRYEWPVTSRSPSAVRGAGDGADGVHEALKAERAAVGAGRDVSREQGFLRG